MDKDEMNESRNLIIKKWLEELSEDVLTIRKYMLFLSAALVALAVKVFFF